MFGVILVVFLIILLVSPVATVRDNSQSLQFGPRILPEMSYYDLLGITLNSLVAVIPFFLFRKYFSTPESHCMILRTLVIMGIIYSFFALVEIRLSPQLHKWIYGFYQHSFIQHVRDGYRPMIFLRHGLWVGFFFLSTVLAAIALWRGKQEGSLKYLLCAVWLFVILFLSRNLGATMLAILFCPILFLHGSLQRRIVSIVAIIFLLYPAVRQTDILPLDSLVEFTAGISPDRASSFQFRLDNEDMLLERTLERPVFGWGTWGRNRVYDDVGNDISITDGIWIVVLGNFGWVGYIAFFGLLVAPALALGRAAKRKKVPIETMCLAVIMAANFLYMVPNSTLSPIGWMLAGALAGFVQFDPVKTAATSPAVPSDTGKRSSYTRFPVAVKVSPPPDRDSKSSRKRPRSHIRLRSPS